MASAAVRMTLKWSVPHGELRPITTALQGLMLSTRTAPGCLRCSLSTDVHHKAEIRYIEEWNSEDALKHQICSNNFGVLLELMERASEHPQIEFTLSGASRGIEYAQDIRGAAAF